jgi:AcrR family transcriptional regulator
VNQEKKDVLPTNNKEFKDQMTEARRIQILLGAAQVFSQKGFHKATTKEIAKTAGVSEGTIYNYFDTKRELLLAMIELVATQSLAAVVKDRSSDDPKAFLRAVLLDRYKLLYEEGQFMAPIIAEIFSDVELRQAVYQQILKPVLAHMEQFFEENIKAGRFRPVNPMVVTRALAGALAINGIFKLTGLDPRYDTLAAETMIEEIVALYVDGVLVEKP